ncbi:MAG: thiamine pyrophosphate-binding protein [Alphaproteobacteria bacterium]|nr:thiamine pyrophosphate-binding protein [Alphaproteobacteria bacterium]
MDIQEKPVAAAGNEIDRPVPSAPSNRVWGSDAIAAMLRELDIPYIALNPGASYRGIHDSIVNYLGNTRPRMLLCLHEESAVALAHGYAKVTGRPMAAFVHSNVGLMHATMAIFNAWCDRAPVLVLGATGPMDSTRRRPWIEWIHTARDQGALIRNFTKWDDQPASVASAQEAILRAWQIANTAPKGPVYVNFDLALQEDEITGLPTPPDLGRFAPPLTPEPAGPLVRQTAELLTGARRPLILAGRGSRDPEAWQRRVALAEAIGARAMTDRKSGATFPTDHPLHVSGTASILDADVILSLDWVDLAGTLRTAHAGKPVTVRIVQVSIDQYVHNGWSMDYQGLPPVDVYLLAEPDAAVPALLAAVKELRPRAPPVSAPGQRSSTPPLSALDAASIIQASHIATALREVLGDTPTTMIRLPQSWSDGLWQFRHPLDYLGTDGGGGIGSGPGMSVGAALALRDAGSDRLPVAILGDGDFLMGVTALWTAVRNSVPLLVIVANNRSFFNDELHQERVALQRGRPPENRWIGQAIRDPDIDLATMARGQGAAGIGPVEDPRKLVSALREAVGAVRAGKVCVVDVRVAPGYSPGATAAIMQQGR